MSAQVLNLEEQTHLKNRFRYGLSKPPRIKRWHVPIRRIVYSKNEGISWNCIKLRAQRICRSSKNCKWEIYSAYKRTCMSKKGSSSSNCRRLCRIWRSRRYCGMVVVWINNKEIYLDFIKKMMMIMLKRIRKNWRIRRDQGRRCWVGVIIIPAIRNKRIMLRMIIARQLV